MTKLPKNLWDRFLFRDRGIIPTARLLIVFVLFSVGVTVLFTSSGVLWRWVFLINGLFLVVSLFDFFISPKKTQFTFQRMVQREMERGMTYTVDITLRNASSHQAMIRLKDDVPQTCRVTFPVEGVVKRKGTTTLSYQVTPMVRGDYNMKKLFVRYRSVFGLWEKQIAVEMDDAVKVIPDLTETKQYLENAQQFLIYEGVKIRKFKEGQGEFAQIRNYVVGDDPRKINWRQTAKLQEIMTNEYEPEHGKYITILIDCGRMMGVELPEGNQLDKALDAAIVVAAAALKKGDSVAVIAFGKDINVYIPPAKGMDHLQKILQSIYDLEAEPYEPNYPEVLGYLQTVQKKRSLILLFSDIHTFLHEESSLIAFKRLRRRHLFLMIGIRDKTLISRANQEPRDVQHALVKSAAQEQINIKKREKTKWEASGLHLVEADEEQLATKAVSHYIHIMNQGLL